jgi:hypothetical protein
MCEGIEFEGIEFEGILFEFEGIEDLGVAIYIIIGVVCLNIFIK